MSTVRSMYLIFMPTLDSSGDPVIFSDLVERTSGTQRLGALLRSPAMCWLLVVMGDPK